jgi:hypothetical protein
VVNERHCVAESSGEYDRAEVPVLAPTADVTDVPHRRRRAGLDERRDPATAQCMVERCGGCAGASAPAQTLGSLFTPARLAPARSRFPTYATVARRGAGLTWCLRGCINPDDSANLAAHLTRRTGAGTVQLPVDPSCYIDSGFAPFTRTTRNEIEPAESSAAQVERDSVHAMRPTHCLCGGANLFTD